jgi:hypothetical protein
MLFAEWSYLNNNKLLDITLFLGDDLLLVLWYKIGIASPIYS